MVIEIYSKKNCIFCTMAKDAFKEELNSEYTEYVVGINATKEDIEKRTGTTISSVPQIFIDNEYIGGYTELISKFNLTKRNINDYRQGHA